MSDLYFLRPTGAAADTKELEYLTALHQSEPDHVRDNATVSSLDILRFLRSRYNITLTHEQALRIVRGLSGDGYHLQSQPQQDKETKTESRHGDNEEQSASSVTNKEQFNDEEDEGHEQKDQDQAEEEEQSQQQEEEKQEEATSSTVKSSPIKKKAKSIKASLLRLRRKKQSLTESSVSMSTTEKTEAPPPEGEIVEEYLDLCQILSILLIPSFARLAKEGPAVTSEGNLTPDKVILEMQGSLDESEMKFKDVFRVLKEKLKGSSDAPPTPDFIAPTLLHMLRDLPPEEHKITEEMIEYLFLKYGEFEQANDGELIRSMTELAKSFSPSGALTSDVLLQCSTSDLALWDVASERSLSSFFLDMFGEADPAKLKHLEAVDKKDIKPAGPLGVAKEKLNEEIKAVGAVGAEVGAVVDAVVGKEIVDDIASHDEEEPPNTSSQKFTVKVEPELSNIDLVTDRHYSLSIAVLIWVFFFVTMVTYGSEMLTEIQLTAEDCGFESVFWCQLLSSIYSWATIAITFSVFGIIQVAPISIGNHPFSTSPRQKLIAALFAIAFSLLPYFALTTTDANTSRITESEKVEEFDERFMRGFKIVTLSFGLFLGAIYLGFFLYTSFDFLKGCISAVIPDNFYASHAVRGYTAMKRAANFKMTNLLLNAYILHDTDASKYFEKRRGSTASVPKDDIAMKNYVLYGEQSELSGGFVWTWRRLLSRSLLQEEGIWIHSRLVFIQCGQIIISLMVIAGLVAQVPVLANNVERAKDELPENSPNWVYDMVPDPWMVYVSLYPATACAGLVCVGLIGLYIPSTVATVLKFRGQLKPSLGNRSFLPLRKGVDTAYMNLANAIYGLLGAVVLWYLVVALIVFIYVWPISRDGVIFLTAWLLGLGITIGLKMVVTGFCRKQQYRAFFRIKPKAARISSLALECWFIGLGGSVLITRLGQFLGGAAFWIGRIDVPFLAEDVSLLGIKLDMVPLAFVKDILLHESHKHPYMERLARLYMMKAYHGDEFVTRAGAAWRRLIVLAFMPWVARYRVFHSDRRQEALEALGRRKKEKGTEDDVVTEEF